jgi:hypothetical protein
MFPPVFKCYNLKIKVNWNTRWKLSDFEGQFYLKFGGNQLGNNNDRIAHKVVYLRSLPLSFKVIIWRSRSIYTYDQNSLIMETNLISYMKFGGSSFGVITATLLVQVVYLWSLPLSFKAIIWRSRLIYKCNENSLILQTNEIEN